MSKKNKATKLIPGYTASAVVAAVIPIPIADAVAISAIQITMCAHFIHVIYGRDFGMDTIKGLVAAYLTSNIGLWVWSLVKIIPGLGTIIGIVGQMTIAGTLTAALGFAIIQLLERNEEINIDNVNKAARQNKRKAKSLAKEKVNEAKKYKDLIDHVNLKQSSDQVTESISFTFNLDKLENPKLKFVNLSSGKEEFISLKKEISHYKFDLKDRESGPYMVSLISDNSIEMSRYFTKL